MVWPALKQKEEEEEEEEEEATLRHCKHFCLNSQCWCSNTYSCLIIHVIASLQEQVGCGLYIFIYSKRIDSHS